MRLLEKGKIGNLEIPNRVVMAPMGTKSEPDGSVSDRDIYYFEERAKGGTGLIITGRFAVTEKYEMRSHHILNNYHHVGRLALLAERVHMHGSKLCIQIGPGLGRIVHQDPFTPPYSASAVPSHYYPNLICKPYEKEDIKYLAWAVGYAASLAKRAGADAVELHAYGGYLLDQFMSTLWNKRTDEYGGDLAGRMRFTMECVEQIKEQAGKDFPLIVKYTANQMCPGGREIEEGVEIAKMLEAAGVDALHVDMGCYECWHKQIPTVYEPDALQLEMGAAVKAAVNIPVIGHGKLHKVELVEQVLADEKLDFVAMGHQMRADPYYVEKVRSGKAYDIVPCIGCNECLWESHLGKNGTCALNPQCEREGDYPVLPAAEPKKLLVIGGGPGGMEAAIVAAERGHQVELWEKSNVLGGKLLAAGAPGFKQDVMRYKDYLEGKLFRSGAVVRMNKTATVDEVVRGKFDKVILASGSNPFIPRIPGVDGANVLEAIAVLKDKLPVGKNVVVIGAGLVGCELALHLAETCDKVTMLEMMPAILYTTVHCQNNDVSLREKLAASNMDIIVDAKTEKITAEYVEYSKDGETKQIPCDTVVIAAGFRSDHTLENELIAAGVDVKVIGEAVTSPGKIYNAVHGGFHAARLL